MPTANQIEALNHRMSEMVALRLAEQTAKRYGTGATAFISFATFDQYTPFMPATDMALAAFVSPKLHTTRCGII